MIAIEFTAAEWQHIMGVLEQHEVQWMSPEWDLEVNIIDRIERALGVE